MRGCDYYTVDRVGKNEKIQWKCERVCNTQDHARCNGRASSYGYFEPVEIITEHNHIPEPELALEEMLQRAKISSDNPRTIMKKFQFQVPTESAPFLCRPANIRQRINRLRVVLRENRAIAPYRVSIFSNISGNSDSP